jgi:hypothetical protein
MALDKKSEFRKLLVEKAIPREFANQAALILKTNGLGIIQPKFVTVDYRRMAEETSVNDVDGGSFYAADKKSTFGLPVFDILTFRGVTYTDFEGNEVTTIGTDANTDTGIPDLNLDIALIEVSNDRNIVMTPVSGRNGTVKEYMSDNDYSINIKGNLINPLAGHHPEVLLKALHSICKAQVQIKVTSSLLYYLDITALVIKKYEFRMVQGFRNVIDFELNCVSDLDPDILETQDATT